MGAMARTVQLKGAIMGHISCTPPNMLKTYSGVTLDIARPEMNNYATLEILLY